MRGLGLTTRTGFGRGVEVGHLVQSPLARLPAARPRAEHRHQDALVSRALEAVELGPSDRQRGGGQHPHRHGVSPDPGTEPGKAEGRAPPQRDQMPLDQTVCPLAPQGREDVVVGQPGASVP
ncbi:MAG: hypothetical protein M3Y38_03090 [Actinomycetota bacterium]|nr:hypothetical protein [Actinomycetota bacterium]